MRFFHTSDWHLGRIFHNRSLLEDQKFLLNLLLDKVEELKPDAFIIAGDVFDRSIPPSEAIELLNTFLETIYYDWKLPMLIIPGNHDSVERLTFGSRMMKEANLHIFGSTKDLSKGITIKDIEFYGLPFLEPEAVSILSGRELTNHSEMMKFLCDKILEENQSKLKKVLISHCFVSGGSVSDSERTLSVGGLDQVSADVFSGFDYVALGHLHAPQSIQKETIRYSGSLMKYSFSEVNHKKGFSVIDFHDKELNISEVSLKPMRDMEVLTGTFDEVLEKAKNHPNKENFFQVKLSDDKVVYEPMAKLREYLPNVLQIERIRNETMKLRNVPDARTEKKGELEMFKDFYFRMKGYELSKENEKIIGETIQSVLQKRQ